MEEGQQQQEGPGTGVWNAKLTSEIKISSDKLILVRQLLLRCRSISFTHSMDSLEELQQELLMGDTAALWWYHFPNSSISYPTWLMMKGGKYTKKVLELQLNWMVLGCLRLLSVFFICYLIFMDLLHFPFSCTRPVCFDEADTKMAVTVVVCNRRTECKNHRWTLLVPPVN